MIDRDMACGVCTYALNAIDDDGTVTFEHPIVPTKDHDPAPVPAHQLADVYRRCHMCSTDEPMWTYRTPQIEAMSGGGTHQITQTYSTQWNICWRCAELIEQHDHVALSRRSIAAIGWRPAGLSAQILADIHRAIVLTREPGRTLLTTGAWSPAQLKAPTLPKIRDRLAGLLCGPVRLPAPLNNAERRTLLAYGLDQARLYWIDPQFTTLVAEVLTDLPRTAVTDRIVPRGSGLLAWSAPVDQRHRIAAASWTPHLDGWQMACYRSLGLNLPTTDIETVRHEIGWLIPIHVAHVPRETTVDGSDPLAALVSAWLIIAQRLTQDDPGSVDRPIRKAYARARRPPPEVRLVRIKPAASPPRPTAAVSDRTTSGRAKPDHRYWVSGHPRNQAHGPGRTLRKKIDIDPYLISIDRTTGVSFTNTAMVAPTLTRVDLGRSVGHGSAQRGEPAKHRGARGPQGGQRPGHRRPGAAVGRGGQRRSTGRSGQRVPA